LAADFLYACSLFAEVVHALPLRQQTWSDAVSRASNSPWADDHAGLVEVIPEAAWRRCYVHLLRNALDHPLRKRGDDCLQELRWLYDRRDLPEAKADLAAWPATRG
jgi:hypothetical protein